MKYPVWCYGVRSITCSWSSNWFEALIKDISDRLMFKEEAFFSGWSEMASFTFSFRLGEFGRDQWKLSGYNHDTMLRSFTDKFKLIKRLGLETEWIFFLFQAFDKGISSFRWCRWSNIKVWFKIFRKLLCHRPLLRSSETIHIPWKDGFDHKAPGSSSAKSVPLSLFSLLSGRRLSIYLCCENRIITVIKRCRRCHIHQPVIRTINQLCVPGHSSRQDRRRRYPFLPIFLGFRFHFPYYLHQPCSVSRPARR